MEKRFSVVLVCKLILFYCNHILSLNYFFVILKKTGIFSKCKQLPETYAKESSRLYQKYRPIEIDPNLSVEIKTEAMTEWMIAAEEILKGIPFNPNEIPEISNMYEMYLRDGTKELLKKLHLAKVPVLVFSAGLGDIVEAILKSQGILFDNVKVTIF